MRVKSVLLSTLLILAPSVSYSKDQGYFNCLKLTDEQKQWFTTPGISNCCQLSDGMPIRFEERPDGTYVLPFEYAWYEAAACRDHPDEPFPSSPQDEDRSHWTKVLPEKFLRKNNPIGVGIVWWENAGYPSSGEHNARCFVGLPKV